MALKRVWIPSPCYHGRNTGGIRIIVLHTAEGARTYQDLGNFFQNYNNQVSSHVGIDDTRGKIGEYVSRGNAAWTQANYNNAALAAELCGFASWTRSSWLNNHENMLRNAADWVREECNKFGIPIKALNDSQAQSGGRGVCEHINLGSGGGGHVDCGSGFPMDKVIEWAQGKDSAADDDEQDEVSMPFYLAPVENSPVAMPRQRGDKLRRLRLFCNTATVEIKVDFVMPGQDDKATALLTTDYNLGPVGVDVPEDCNAVVLRRGAAPEDGSAYPLVSCEILT